MSKRNLNNLKVGLTVFAGIIILFIFSLLVGTNDFLFSKTYNLFIDLNNTSGLVVGAPVTLGGYKIGDVEAIDFVTINNRPTIRVKLRVEYKYKEEIREDSRVRITSIGILGDKFVDITIGNPSSGPIPENSFLQVEPSVSLDNLAKDIVPGLEKFNSIMDNLKTMTDSISKGKGTVGELINNPSAFQRLNSAIMKIDAALNTLENKKGSLNRLLYDSTLYNSLSSTALSLKTLSTNLTSGHGTLGKLITDDSLYLSLLNSSGQLNRFFSRAQNDSTVIGGLLSDRKLYGDINSLIKELNFLISDIKQHPERYVKVSVF